MRLLLFMFLVSVSLRILDKLDSTKVIKTLCNKNLQAGAYTYLWNGMTDTGERVTNNIYNYQLIASEFRDVKNLFINMIDPEQIKSLNSIPLATSDSKGNIDVEYSIFPINMDIFWTDESGNLLDSLTIPNSISLAFLKNGYLSVTKEVTITGDKPMELMIVLDKELY